MNGMTWAQSVVVCMCVHVCKYYSGVLEVCVSFYCVEECMYVCEYVIMCVLCVY